MKLKLAALCSVTLLACAAASAPAFAGSMTWNFLSLAGNPPSPGMPIGLTDSFMQGGMTLSVQSETSAGCGITMPTCAWSAGTADLYAKNGGSAYEDGLGLTGDPSNDHEIYYPNGIMVTLPTGTSAASVMIGSIQGTSTSGETWAVYGYDSSQSTWNLLGNGMGGNTENFNSASLMGYSQLVVSDPSRTPYTNSNDVVLMSITTVPEPGTLALFGAGLLGCALFIARRRARQS